MPPTNGTAEIYELDRWFKLYRDSRDPSIENLRAAAQEVARICRENDIIYCFNGGWALHLRGNDRTPKDIDIAVDASILKLCAVFRQYSSICFPHNVLLRQIARCTIYVKVPGKCLVDPPIVEVDIVPQGDLYMPPMLPRGIEWLDAGERWLPEDPVPVLDLVYQVRTKLRAHSVRQLWTKVDIEDLKWLLGTYRDEIYKRYENFGTDDRRECFKALDAEDKRWGEYAWSVLGLGGQSRKPYLLSVLQKVT